MHPDPATGHLPQPDRRRLLGLGVAACPLVALPALSACSTSAAPGRGQGLLRDADYPPPDETPPGTAALTALSPAMRAFLDSQPWAAMPTQDLRRALVQALYRPRGPGSPGLRLEYESSRTRTAAEAFEAGAGNCLSLVLMTAALARHLGLSVSFQSVQVSDTYARAGSLTLVSGHVNLVLGPRPPRSTLDRSDPHLLVVDFVSPREIRQQRTLPLRDATVHAMFFNNRAAELLAEGRVGTAYWHAREALAQDPGFVPAVNTLGVVHRRAGLLDTAERAFRLVLEHDARAVGAMRNLHGLLVQQGRQPEAEALASRLAALEPMAPFHGLAAAIEALKQGDASAALGLLQRELALQPEHPEVHAALAAAHLQLGRPARARRHLALAAEFSTRPAEQRRLEGKLAQLQASTPP